MNGEEMLRRLRDVDPHVQVVLCTGASTASPVHDWESLNISGILRKPYTYRDLRLAMASTISA
jgi:DNA-binding NarL/FixJ family response regulator